MREAKYGKLERKVNCLQPRCHTTPIRLAAARQQSSAAVALPTTNSQDIPHFPLPYSTAVNISAPSPSNSFSNRLKKSPQENQFLFWNPLWFGPSFVTNKKLHEGSCYCCNVRDIKSRSTSWVRIWNASGGDRYIPSFCGETWKKETTW